MLALINTLWSPPSPLPATPEQLYPPYIADIFEQYSFKGEKLPVLNLKSSESPDGKISFIHPNNMVRPLMRLEDDFGHKGIALHVTIKKDRAESLSIRPGFESVWVVFQRTLDNGSLCWEANDVGTLQYAIEKRDPDSFTYEEPISKELLSNLLTGKDEDLKLGKSGFTIL